MAKGVFKKCIAINPPMITENNMNNIHCRDALANEDWPMF